MCRRELVIENGVKGDRAMVTDGELDKLLKNRNLVKIKALARDCQDVIRKLSARIYQAEGLMLWRAVEALGVAAQAAEERKPGSAVELCRRYFWALNEESGGSAWNAGHALGSIISRCPKQCGHFNSMYGALLDDPGLRQGVFWGLVQIAQTAPEVVDPLESDIRPFLCHQEAEVRLWAHLLYALMSRSSGTAAGWRLPQDEPENLRADIKLSVYQNGRLQEYTADDLRRPQTFVSYWTERVDIKPERGELMTYDFTVAVSAEGVCWMSLGAQQEQEEILREYVARWYPRCYLIRDQGGTNEARRQIHEYLAGERRTFDLKLDPQGTPFQKRVWQALLQIPYGETCSYEEIARVVGSPQAQRAVGMANHNNPIIITIPCHRVIGKNGSLTGYGAGLELKQYLLDLESRH